MSPQGWDAVDGGPTNGPVKLSEFVCCTCGVRLPLPLLPDRLNQLCMPCFVQRALNGESL